MSITIVIATVSSGFRNIHRLNFSDPILHQRYFRSPAFWAVFNHDQCPHRGSHVSLTDK